MDMLKQIKGYLHAGAAVLAFAGTPVLAQEKSAYSLDTISISNSDTKTKSSIQSAASRYLSDKLKEELKNTDVKFSAKPEGKAVTKTTLEAIAYSTYDACRLLQEREEKTRRECSYKRTTEAGTRYAGLSHAPFLEEMSSQELSKYIKTINADFEGTKTTTEQFCDVDLGPSDGDGEMTKSKPRTETFTTKTPPDGIPGERIPAGYRLVIPSAHKDRSIPDKEIGERCEAAGNSYVINPITKIYECKEPEKKVTPPKKEEKKPAPTPPKKEEKKAEPAPVAPQPVPEPTPVVPQEPVTYVSVRATPSSSEVMVQPFYAQEFMPEHSPFISVFGLKAKAHEAFTFWDYAFVRPTVDIQGFYGKFNAASGQILSGDIALGASTGLNLDLKEMGILRIGPGIEYSLRGTTGDYDGFAINVPSQDVMGSVFVEHDHPYVLSRAKVALGERFEQQADNFAGKFDLELRLKGNEFNLPGYVRATLEGDFETPKIQGQDRSNLSVFPGVGIGYTLSDFLTLGLDAKVEMHQGNQAGQIGFQTLGTVTFTIPEVDVLPLDSKNKGGNTQ